MAVDAHAAPKRQRSAPLPKGIMAASPALNMPSSTASDTGDEPNSMPLRRNPREPIQFQLLPWILNACAGRPRYPCQANPIAKYTRAATAITHNELSIECAALRERPNPALMRAIPASAQGTRRMRTKQRPAAVSDRTGAGIDVTLHPHAGLGGNERRGSAPITARRCRPARTRPGSARTVKARLRREQ